MVHHDSGIAAAMDSLSGPFAGPFVGSISGYGKL